MQHTHTHTRPCALFLHFHGFILAVISPHFVVVVFACVCLLFRRRNTVHGFGAILIAATGDSAGKTSPIFPWIFCCVASQFGEKKENEIVLGCSPEYLSAHFFRATVQKKSVERAEMMTRYSGFCARCACLWSHNDI